MDEAAFELLMDTGDREWVDSLCPRDLWHYYDMLLRKRTSRLREQLHVLVTAAAVTVDKGKAFEAMDEALAKAERPRGSRAGRAGSGAEPPAEKPKPLDTSEQAHVAALLAETDGLWRKR
ncbi:hypothetical protein [Methylobacterium indicum]|uniref:Uncharacterized protein n=1 Tax=Methylobacterium indicum TaxID=1775910 RepID=A0A8H9C676_9HYPH|nr:hypothetical protein [Methylobacterium indicum]BCM83598.1 hypothetical protein mvi_20590 [Methylobacterium indicum]